MTSVDQFWQLAANSGLLSAAQVERLSAEFHATRAPVDDAAPLARWLVDNRTLSPYQATVLKAGHAGPFFYGDYLVYHRYTSGLLAGMFRAVHLPSQHVVVLRFLSGPATADTATMSRLAQLVAEAASLPPEPRRSRAWALVDLPQYKFLVAEALDGQPLDAWLAQAGPQPIGESCRVVREVALALTSLHESNQVHAALQPAAVLRTPGGAIQTLAFPLFDDPLTAGASSASSAVRLARALLGSNPPAATAEQLAAAAAVAPELLGGAPPSPRSDVYALGWLLYTLLRGGVPALDPRQLAAELRERVASPLPALGGPAGPLAPQIQKLLGFFLARDPQARYATASQVAQALAPFAARSPVQVAAPEVPAAASAFHEHLGAAAPAEDTLPLDLGLASAPAPAPRPAASPAPARRRWPLWVSPLVLAVVLAIGAYVLRGRDTAPTTSTAPPRQAAANKPAAPSSVASTKESPAAEPSGRLGPALWERPSQGDRVSLAWLPPGAQVIIALRPAPLMAHVEGRKLWDALGPLGESFVAQIESLTGGPLHQCDQVLVGCYDLSPAPAETAWVIRRSQPWDTARVPLAQGAPSEQAGRQIYRDAQHAAVFVEHQGAHLLIVCPPSRLDDLLAADGAQPDLRREFEALWATSDDSFVLNALLSPTFLTRGGKSLMPAAWQPLDVLAEQFLTPQATAAFVAVQLDQDLFVELRVAETADRPPLAAATRLRDGWLAVPSRLEQHLAALTPSAYSAEVLARYPAMVQALVAHTRADVVDRHVVFRAYLPAEAAPNLLWGTRLALRESPRGPTSPSTVAATPARPIAEVLKQPYSLRVPRAPLDRTLEQMATDLGIEIVILGADLQLDGITKNQPLSLDERDSTAGAVLRRILALANADGKLVYVIKPRADGTGEALYITTRAAAALRGDILPPELAETK